MVTTGVRAESRAYLLICHPRRSFVERKFEGTVPDTLWLLARATDGRKNKYRDRFLIPIGISQSDIVVSGSNDNINVICDDKVSVVEWTRCQ